MMAIEPIFSTVKPKSVPRKSNKKTEECAFGLRRKTRPELMERNEIKNHSDLERTQRKNGEHNKMQNLIFSLN
jgi:hypothetical protein